MAKQDNRHHCYLSTIFVCMDRYTGGRCHLGKSTDNFRILKRLENDYCQGCLPLSRINISFHICDCTNPVFTNTPPKHQTHGRLHYDVHTVLKISIVCSTFLLLFTTYTREFYPQLTPHFIRNIILFHCSCIVQCSLFRHHRTRFFFYFQFFRNNSLVKAINYFYKTELEQTD